MKASFFPYVKAQIFKLRALANSPLFLFIDILQRQGSEIELCDVMVTGLVISATCAFSSSSLATGFLMTVQRRSVDKARRLLVNRTLDGQIQGPVTVAVGEFGASYQVTIFPTKRSTGILGFSPNTVPYTAEISTARLQQPTSELLDGIVNAIRIMG